MRRQNKRQRQNSVKATITVPPKAARSWATSAASTLLGGRPPRAPTAPSGAPRERAAPRYRLPGAWRQAPPHRPSASPGSHGNRGARLGSYAPSPRFGLNHLLRGPTQEVMETGKYDGTSESYSAPTFLPGLSDVFYFSSSSQPPLREQRPSRLLGSNASPIAGRRMGRLAGDARGRRGLAHRRGCATDAARGGRGRAQGGGEAGKMAPGE